MQWIVYSTEVETLQEPVGTWYPSTTQHDGYQPQFLSVALSKLPGPLLIPSPRPSSHLQLNPELCTPELQIFLVPCRDPTMAASCGTALSGARLDSKLGSSLLPRPAGLSSSSSLNNGAFRAVEMRGVAVSMPVRKSLQVVAMAPPKAAGKAKKGISLVGIEKRVNSVLN